MTDIDTLMDILVSFYFHTPSETTGEVPERLRDPWERTKAIISGGGE